MDSLEVYTRFTMVDCPLGVPGLSIPIGLAADGMPIGIMLQGRPGNSLTHPSVMTYAALTEHASVSILLTPYW